MDHLQRRLHSRVRIRVGGNRLRVGCRGGVCRRWGERVLNWRVVRWVLTAPREERLKEAYRQHAIKTVATARHVAGLRAAAFLTAGIARVPFWKFIMADAAAKPAAERGAFLRPR